MASFRMFLAPGPEVPKSNRHIVFNLLMRINASSICHYLIGKGMVSNEAVVDGDFTVIDLGGRNGNFKVIGRKNAGYFVKANSTMGCTNQHHASMQGKRE
jgi:hypothetical protein